MMFGPSPVDDALGCILAHSVRAGDTRLRKGLVLTHDHLDRLAAAGITHVTVARLDPTDLDEDTAAATIAASLDHPGVSISAPFTGRANVYADAAGLIGVDAGKILSLNDLDESITLATLPHLTRVQPRQMLATVKIIPYGAPGDLVTKAARLAHGALTLHRFRDLSVSLIQTRLPDTPDKVLAKGTRVTTERLAGLGLSLSDQQTCAHDTEAVAGALSCAPGDLVLILGASATSDRLDVCPAGLLAAGGTLTRFGMPVDPGNLLFFGQRGAQQVVGLPGCARSPALNGADWVLERIAAGLSVTGPDIAMMGVGGLLKEIPTRPQPRSGNPKVPKKPRIEAIILAAGQSSRMRGADKLLQVVDGTPQLARINREALEAQIDRVQVVLPDGPSRRHDVLSGMPVTITPCPQVAEGMAASIRAGLAARHPDSDAVMLILADMPDITANHMNRLIAGFDPSEGRTIVQARDAAGTPGHPVLFGRRFFEALQALTGDTGARDVVAEARDYLVHVDIDGTAATTDLDTPEAWASWRAQRDTPS